jgi:ATP-binding cassette subfamily C protein
LSDAFQVLGWRLVVLLLVIPVAGILEGFSLVLLFPLLVEMGVATDDSGLLGQAVHGLLALSGLPRGIGPLLFLIVLVLQLQVAMTLLRGALEADCQSRYQTIWKRRLFEAFVGARWAQSMHERTAAQSNAILTETGRISTALGQTITIIGNAVMASIYVAISLVAAWQVVLLLGAFGAAICLATRPLTRRGSALGHALSDAAEAMHHATSEFLTNMKLIKATSTEARAVASFDATTEVFRGAVFRSSLHPRVTLALYMCLGYFLFGGGIYVALEVLALSPASIVVAIYVFLRLYVQISNLQQTRQSLAVALPGLPVAASLLRRAEAAHESPHGGVTLSAQGPAALALRNVEARYGDHIALIGLTQSVEPGAVIGLTGPSGAGKSTFVDVVAGLVQPSAGTVEIDGIPIDDINIRGWRRTIGYVAQDTLLLRASVRDNIAWGEPTASEAAIEQAARLAHADRFIHALPQGYDTPIGDRGVRLSGGQRQRIGLARALLGDKRLLILDEATSALDSESEAKVLEAIESLRGRMTVIMVAHRLSTLRPCDRVLVFEDGRLVEVGGFAELIRQGGSFARLWHLQSQRNEAAAS